jgi:hypothetical protein
MVSADDGDYDDRAGAMYQDDLDYAYASSPNMGNSPNDNTTKWKNVHSLDE